MPTLELSYIKTMSHTSPLARALHYLSLHRLRVLILFACVFLPLVVVGKIADNIVDRESFGWDNGILLWFHAHSSSALNPFVLFFTNLGGPIVMPLASTAVVIALYTQHQRSRALFFGVAMLGELLLNQGAKLVFARPRPDLWAHLVNEKAFSFPSGHAMASSAFVTALVLLLWYTRWRNLAVVLGAIFVLLVCSSRLYLGVHYPSDVLTGALASLAWVVGLRQIFRNRDPDVLKARGHLSETGERAQPEPHL